MTKVVHGAVSKNDVVTKFYDDGRVIQQYHRNAAWVQICDPDKFVHEVGICTKCGRMIYGDDEWKFPKSGPQSVWHTYPEDCTKKKDSDNEDS